MSHRVFPSVVPCPVRPRGEPCADGGSCSSRGCLPIFLPAGQELVQQGLTFIFLFFQFCSCCSLACLIQGCGAG